MPKPYYTESFVTGEFRAAFEHLLKPDAFPGKDPKYSVTMVLDPKDAIPIRKMLIKAAQGLWGPDVKKWPLTLRKNDLMAYLSPNAKDGWPIRDGDDVADKYDGFEGKVYVKAASKRAPGIVNIKREPIMDAEEIHSGVICRARVQAYAIEGSESAGVYLSLDNVLVVKDDGTNWGGGSRRVKAENDFDDILNEYDDGSDDAGNYATGTDGDL